MAPIQSICNGPAWISDVALLEGPASRTLAVAAHDRTVGDVCV
jgi:hypothetical protein